MSKITKSPQSQSLLKVPQPDNYPTPIWQRALLLNVLAVLVTASLILTGWVFLYGQIREERKPEIALAKMETAPLQAGLAPLAPKVTTVLVVPVVKNEKPQPTPTPVVTEEAEEEGSGGKKSKGKKVVEDPPPGGKKIKVRVSHYNPSLGGPNCSNFVNGQCIASMASGRPWKPYFNKAFACVPEWNFGTELYIFGQKFVCWDRGGKIKTVGGVPWVDLLTASAPVPYGTVVDAVVVFKGKNK